MGANAQTAVPAFTAGQVLTAEQMTEVNTGIPVFADSAARDAAFGGSGEKVLAEGQFAFLEDSNTTQFYDGAAWKPVGVAPGLVLIKTQTIGTTVASVNVTDAFSSTYENYKIIVSGGAPSTDCYLRMTLGASVTGYYEMMIFAAFATGTIQSGPTNNGSRWSYTGDAESGQVINMNTDLLGPQLAKYTRYGTNISYQTGTGSGVSSGVHKVATAYTDFTITPSTGTLTGGTIFVYGYAKS
jgi:hypothetical protein